MASTGLSIGQGSFSDYYYSLDKPSRSRYREKIAKLGGMKDPYLIERLSEIPLIPIHGKTGLMSSILISSATSFIQQVNTLEKV